MELGCMAPHVKVAAGSSTAAAGVVGGTSGTAAASWLIGA
jgi:hypothetical protein